jgi:hypothetical protein
VKKVSLRKLKARAWKVYSQFIRIMASNPDGYAECVTCKDPKPMPWKQLQAGHFVSGRGNSVLFAEYNVHPQCYVCNILLKGNWPAYYEYMQKTYGQATIERLIKLKHETRNLTVEDYENIINLNQIKEK